MDTHQQLAHERTLHRAHKFRHTEIYSQKYQELLTDPLTGLPSRFAIEHLIGEFDPSEYPSNTVLCCIYIDLQGMKAINDQYGHDAGNDYIRRCGTAFAHYFRTEEGNDLVVHPGLIDKSPVFKQNFTGDEFVILLLVDGSYRDQINRILTRRLHNLKAADPEIKFRFGLSLAGLPPGKQQSSQCFRDLIAAADRDLNVHRK